MPDIDASPATEWTRLASARVPGVELLAARFVHHSFARHAHESYVLAVIDAGTQTFRYRGCQRVATAGEIVVLEPGEAHDGRPLGESGYAYRTLHLDPEILVGEDRRGGLPAFPEPILRDELLRSRVSALCDVLEAGDASPEDRGEALLRTTSTLSERHARGAVPSEGRTVDVTLAEEARRRLAERIPDSGFTIEDLAFACGVSRAHLTRVFAAQFGMPPHAWLVQQRLSRARLSLLAGQPAASVAVESGFTDQSHFVKRFKSVYGVTPGQWTRRA